MSIGNWIAVAVLVLRLAAIILRVTFKIMTEYGLPDVRDPDTGERNPVTHEFEFDGHDVKIEFIPLTLSEIQELQGAGADIELQKLEELIDDHLLKPEQAAADLTEREINAYIMGMRDYSEGGSDFRRARQRIAGRADGGARDGAE